ncbi:MAG: glycosyltransferase [Cyanobacteria bacterium J06643_4]
MHDSTQGLPTQGLPTQGLKVAFVVHEFPVLSETFVINQAIGLLDRGCDVDILTTRLGDVDKVHPDVEKYNLLAHTHVLPSVPQNYVKRIARGLGIVVRHGRQQGVEIMRSLNPFTRGIRALSLWSLCTVVAARDWASYDIIHCQFGNLGFYGEVLRDFSPATKLVVMFRGFDISQQVKREGDRLYRSLFSQADLFLTNCEFFRQRLLAMGAPPERTKVHYSGLDSAKFPLALRHYDSDSDGPIRIASTGRLVEKKGFEYCIRAIAQLTKIYPHLSYQIMGDGPLREQLSALILELGLTETVQLLGWCDEAEIVQVLARSHLFIAPSVTSAEGNQDAPINVLKEAMALGLPVVSTTHGGIPELVEHDVSGLLVPERDSSAIAQALTKLIEQPERWLDMGKAGRAYVETHYDLNNLNDRLIEVYQMLIDEEGEDSLPTRSQFSPIQA